MDIKDKVRLFFEKYPSRSFDKRELLLRAEEPIPSIFYLTEGRVSQYDITPNGNEIVVNVFKPGAFFPMSSAINNSPNHYFFEASTKTIVRTAPAAETVQFLKNNPEILFDLLARVYRGVDGVLRRMAHLMGGDAKTRLLFEILNAAYRFGDQQKDGSVLIKLSEGDLARHSGLARETVNRNIQTLKTAGLLTITHDGLIIKDTGAIEHLLGTSV